MKSPVSEATFVFPLDHPLKYTADYQKQTVEVIQRDYSGRVIFYHAYLERKTWKDLFSGSLWKLFFKQLQAHKKSQALHLAPIHLLPLERVTAIYELNKKLSFVLALAIGMVTFRTFHLIFWLFHPQFYDLVVFPHRVAPRLFYLFYDCLDYFELENPEAEAKLRKSEDLLFKEADLVTTNSQLLAKKHRSKRPDISPVAFGFRASAFEKHKQFAPTERSKSELKIIYVGTINYRLDFELISSLLTTYPKISFTFIGPLYTETSGTQDVRSKFKKLFQFSNFHHFDYLLPSELPSHLMKANIGIIPYDMNVVLNQHCNPLKLLEYFYFGLPVISAPIPSLNAVESPFVTQCGSLADWRKAIEQYAKKGPSLRQQKEMRAFSLQNSWEVKIGQILSKMGEV